MITRRTFSRLAALAPLLGTAPLSLPAALAQSAQDGGQRTLRFATANSLSRLNPQMHTNWPDIYVFEAIYDGLTRRDADNRLVPGLALEWRTIDAKTWQFKLRPNVRFHNGDTLTAADVKFTLDRALDPAAKTVIAGLFNVIERVDVIDTLTVNIVTKQPDPLQPQRHAVWGNGGILPAAYFQKLGAEAFEAKPVGTGPFRVVDWAPGTQLTLQAFSDYWGGAPNAEGMVLRPIPDGAARVAALLSGEANFIDFVPPQQVDRLKAQPELKVVSYTYPGYVATFLNAGKPFLGNTNFKQALSLMIDRSRVIRETARGQAVLPTGFIPPGDFAYRAELPVFRFDPAGARKQLSDSGYRGEEILVETSDLHRPWMELVASMWREAGVNVRTSRISEEDRGRKIRERDYSVMVGDPGSTIGDPDGLIWRNLSPDGRWPSWRNAEFDRLGLEARSSLDQDLRRRNYHRMEDIMLAELPWIPIYQPVHSFAMSSAIQWRPAPTSSADFRRDNFSFVR
jgi:peptide/nickel transport system substrate-binding protein